MSCAKAFLLYGHSFVLPESTRLEDVDYSAALAARERAFRLFQRSRARAVGVLERRYPGIEARLSMQPKAAAQELGPDDLEATFWAGIAWGSAISAGLDRPEVVADVDAVRALLFRALAFDESYERGMLHETLIAIEGLPEAMGGSQERARAHYQRALELSGGHRASVHLSLAKAVAIPNQDRVEFEALVELALAIDPDQSPDDRLSNVLAQREARQLLDRVEDLILEPL